MRGKEARAGRSSVLRTHPQGMPSVPRAEPALPPAGDTPRPAPILATPAASAALKTATPACAVRCWHLTAPFQRVIFPSPCPSIAKQPLSPGNDEGGLCSDSQRFVCVPPAPTERGALSNAGVKQVLKTLMLPVLVSQKVDISTDGFSCLVKPELPVLISCFLYLEEAE